MSKRPYAHRKAQKEGKKLDNYVCAICGADLPENAEGHHIIEYCEGGAATTQNIITLCHDCHLAYHRGEIDVDIIRF